MSFLKNSVLLLLLGAVAFSCKETKEEPLEMANQKPNIVYILADDLGYGEIGIFGQDKIETPNIDALAKGGMLFPTLYQCSRMCSGPLYVFDRKTFRACLY